MSKKQKFLFLLKSANAITLLRVFAAPVFLFFLISLPQKIAFLRWLSGVLFVIIALTDLLDGYLARKNLQVSRFGKCFDHIADKVLVVLVLLALVNVDKASLIPTALIFLREIIVSGVREFIAIENHAEIPVNSWSKTKTGLQMTAITILLVASKDGYLIHVGNFVLYAASLLAAVTMYDHLKTALCIMSSTTKNDSKGR